ncbi:MAG: hypothetical protein IGR76_08555 [Synechococcales cyanobacterium T60_A2020_003]|nr:hypothetical protein [Synechococcales cyanobacterium T60_A2020_003]
MRRAAIALLLCLFLVWVSGCTPGTSSYSEPTPTVPTANSPIASDRSREGSLPAELETQLRVAIAADLGLAADSLTVKTAEAVDWSDACLGAARPDEGCAQMITPGYRVVFTTPNGEVVVHSDRTGSSYRIVSP